MAYSTADEPFGLLRELSPVFHLPFEVGYLLPKVTIFLE
jgi:hypothetical protein